MNSKILTLLEFNKITDLLSQQAGSALTKERISKLAPMTNMRMTQDALTETTEAVSVILYKGNIPVCCRTEKQPFKQREIPYKLFIVRQEGSVYTEKADTRIIKLCFP